MPKTKKLLITGIIITSLIFIFAATIYASPTKIKLTVDGKVISLSIPPELVNGKVMVPLKDITEPLKLQVDYNQEQEILIITKGDIKLEMGLNQTTAVKNGKNITLDAPPFLNKDKLMVPLEFISNNLGMNVNWNEKTQTLSIEAKGLPVLKSFEHLKELLENSQNQNMNFFRRLTKDLAVMEDGAIQKEKVSANQAALGADSKNSYSTTNLQVQGVDEGDIIKTDGQYIYHVSNQQVVITKAQPANEMKVVKTIKYGENFYPQELYIDNKYLVVIGSNYHNQPRPIIAKDSANPEIYPPIHVENTVKAFIYELNDRSNLELVREIELEGNYISSRKIDSALYLVSNKYLDYYRIMKEDNISSTPAYRDSAVNQDFAALDYTDIRYFPECIQPNYLIVAELDLKEPAKGMQVSSYLGAGENIYASPNNLYVALTKYSTEKNKAENMQKLILPRSETKAETVIYKFALDQGQIKYQQQGIVPGTILNQFSMDEHKGYFRIATTKGEIWQNDENTSKNNIYILDNELNIKGKIEDIAPGERIYSVRFMGDRAYMVTFKTVDPLFVLDLKDPASPKILGALKIPGYSDYLHPYDENHIIGFGKDTIELSQKGNKGNEVETTAFYQGMKIALFDVSNVEKPIEMFKEVIGDRGTDSEVLNNHKALLFAKDKNLLAFPITVMEVKGSKVDPNGFPKYGELTFQGAYVYNLDLEKGFILKGKISHLTDEQYLKSGQGWYNSDRNIQRIIYINNNLYTISNALIKANDLTNLREIGTVSLPQ
ncbi:MAG TPA: hypothetical protein GXX38_08390 [Clostridia bacterium]|nr:hypothetical protein [Clostridia bacterium]